MKRMTVDIRMIRLTKDSPILGSRTKTKQQVHLDIG